MRVVMVSPWGSARCGLRSYSKCLAEELSRYVELIVVPHYRYAQPTVEYARWLTERVNRLGPDVVHIQHEYGVWNPWDPGVFLEFLRLVKGRKVVTMHSTGFPIEKAISDLCDAVVVHNRHMFSVFQGDKGKCFIIPHGCKLIDTSKEVARRRLGVKPNAYLVGVFGFIDPRKGHDIALEAYSRLRGRAEMVFVGGWHSDRLPPYTVEILRRAKEMGVKVTGYVDDQAFELWLSAVDVVLHPARVASESGIVSAALGAGKPIVVADHPAFHGKLAVRFRSVGELAEILERLRDPELRASCERLARRIARLCSWSQVAWLHHSLYRWLHEGDMYSLIQLNGVKDAIWQLAELDLHGSIEAERDPIHKPRLEWIRARLKHPSVDVGSSFGYLGADVNIDVSRCRAMLGKLLYPDREFIVADAHHLPFKSSAFRQALLCEVLEHVENPGQALREAERISREIVATVPDENPPFKPSYSVEHVRLYTKESLEELAGKAGLKVSEYQHLVNREHGYAWHCLVARRGGVEGGVADGC